MHPGHTSSGMSITRLFPIFLAILLLYMVLRTYSPPLKNVTLSPHDGSTILHRSSNRTGEEQSGSLSSTLQDGNKRPVYAIPGSRLQQSIPECARNKGKAKTFLFVFMGHSGSTAMISELRSHPVVHIEASELVDHGEYAKNTTLALQHTRKFFKRTTKFGKTSGFKIRPSHITKKPQEWAALIREFDTRIVWQHRHNLLKQAVGEYSSKYLNDKASVEGLKSQEEAKARCNTGVGCSFKIENFKEFHRFLKDGLHSDKAIAEAVNLLSNGSSCVHALPYEDYLYDRKLAMKKLQDFLGLTNIDTKPQRYKATGDNLCDVVTNWKELCDNFYACHVWRHMFDDLRNDCVCEFTNGHVQYCDTHYTG
ncbi:hypothetical protein BWQ96_01739 [Gracilariopsis chorda]|uniref:Uncharacterized protein n=1 Tax=Gracilariopsis chorda TaxID=448386 RepID=A0A2V3J5B6_9FLOR|nr:hypothetical protein BWQ96_01739 [Gracilariopsis chorda]|eukprot:PXF48570.1 hypothetical protein BWQ96_01739 [Gracilariopsis chorda]